MTRMTGRPELPVGCYVLERDRQGPPHDRKIPDAVRGAVLRRDNYACQKCQWSYSLLNPSDPRFLELHHRKQHVDRGENVEENLITLCNICHDRIHAKD